jgi:hypothetical protein
MISLVSPFWVHTFINPLSEYPTFFGISRINKLRAEARKKAKTINPAPTLVG